MEHNTCKLQWFQQDESDSCLTISNVYRISLAWAVHFRGQVQFLSLASAPLSADFSWQPPQQGWFCLNIDAAVTAITSMGSIRGVTCGSSGEWIVGYTKQIGHVSPLQAKLWSILVGLEVDWSMGVEHLQIQTDCKQASNHVLSGSESSSITIVRAIRFLRNRVWYTDLFWIPREYNMVADTLSNIITPQPYSLLLHESAPTTVHSLLERDAYGPSYRRHVQA
ncbi:hypothetical protein V6N12_042135 [Hibiscus sabdariffa]|uniref:RNase H type-1 domain-containing protein n=1 Tax=Hibiscus sabdariffa TaxID=183260 RepID=A0ABR2EDW5_9ROSI